MAGTRDYNNANAKTNAVESSAGYSDFDINFVAHPISGDIAIKRDSDAIKRSVRNIILTNHYERPFKPNFGANLRGLLFELADDITKYEIRKQINEAIQSFEPRVRVQNIYLNQDRGNRMYVNLHYGIVGVAEPQELEVILQRVR